MRAQTTINVSRETLETMDELSRGSGVSRSMLFDLAARHFVSWARALTPDELRLVTKAKIQEPVSGYVRKADPEAIKRKAMEDTQKALMASERAIARSLGVSL